MISKGEIYDEREPSGYSIHNEPNTDMQTQSSLLISPRATQWAWGSNDNTLLYQASDDSFLGAGRATYYTGAKGNRDNTLKNYDCATHKSYDYSKKGDKDVTIRNVDTNTAYVFHQADVGSLPDAVVDIWGLSNLHTLAGKTGVTSVSNVRYYHKRFSDQGIPK